MNKLFLMAVLITAVLVSCKKDSTPAPICRIITVSPVSADGGTTYNFSYNSEGKLSSSSSSTSTSVTTYSYSGNTVIASTTSGGVFKAKEIITLNANGMASNVKTENDEAGTSWDNTLEEYSGTELIKSTSTSSSGGPADVTTFVWSGGNLVSSTSGSLTTTIDYYTDKPAQTGDYLSLLQLEDGYEVFRVKNAIKSFLVGSTIFSYSYSFGSDGKIASIAITTGTDTSTDDYQYQCN
jgi:hypothetical protein